MFDNVAMTKITFYGASVTQQRNGYVDCFAKLSKDKVLKFGFGGTLKVCTKRGRMGYLYALLMSKVFAAKHRLKVMFETFFEGKLWYA